MIKKADILLGMVFFSIGLIFFTVLVYLGSAKGGYIQVEKGGELYGEYTLSNDQEIKVDKGKGYNTIRIQEGKVSMRDASCPDQYCVNHKSINLTSETIVCLPNQLVITVKESEAPKIDAITN